ncbi:MAG: aromatic ring-hydroxylating dioxygenase subunit alpha [Chloroflexaceae bacterium]|jgi:Rieske 2Fe-2S family protein|nr:aromatic ring-hydroxylating dioxygenase subunit alpha [Chloroflexaceae bacterium]
MTVYTRAAVDQGAFTLPGRYYTSNALFQQEMERIFTRQWMLVGRAEQLPNPGDYFLISIGPENLIIVRDRQGSINALYNVCRHRGTRMCTTESGSFNESIQCPYHAWTYGLDGRLLAARMMQEVAGFDKNDYPLHQASVAEWEGFIFVNLAATPEPFEHAFAPLLQRFPQWQMGNLRVGQCIEYNVQANWKLIFQNYSECYHCALIHPKLVELSPWQSGRNDLSEGPFLGGYMDLNHDSMTTSGHTPRPPVGSVSGADLARVYYYSIMPNMLLSMHPDYVMAHTLWPQGPGETRIICEWLFDPATMARTDFDARDAVEFWDMTNQQDWHVSELSQLGVASRAYTPGPYAQQEGLLWAFDRYYLGLMG